MDLARVKKKRSEIDKKVKKMGGRDARTQGNPNSSNIDRELASAGKKREPDDIPKQDKVDRRGQAIAGNVGTGFKSSTVETGGKYKIGIATRPPIHHDKGFSILPTRDPEFADYLAYAKWLAMLEGAEALRPDLADATRSFSWKGFDLGVASMGTKIQLRQRRP